MIFICNDNSNNVLSNNSYSSKEEFLSILDQNIIEINKNTNGMVITLNSLGQRNYFKITAEDVKKLSVNKSLFALSVSIPKIMKFLSL